MTQANNAKGAEADVQGRGNPEVSFGPFAWARMWGSDERGSNGCGIG